MNYLESAQLMQDAEFMQRCSIAALHFASYIQGEATSVPAHQTRLRWANATVAQPTSAVIQTMPVLIMDPKVQTDGKNITDPDLQSAFESSVEKMI